ncbi:MAG: hypothetical protein AAF485_09070 [Chloroflexota bacterium]
MVNIYQEKSKPIVIVEWRDTLTEQDVDMYLQHYETILDDNQPYVMIVDATRAKQELAITRKRIFKRQRHWLVKREAQVNGMCQGIAYVIDSPSGQAAQRAQLRIKPTVYPSVVLSTRDNALSWASKRLAV